jgi:thioredoxin 1
MSAERGQANTVVLMAAAVLVAAGVAAWLVYTLRSDAREAEEAAFIAVAPVASADTPAAVGAPAGDATRDVPAPAAVKPVPKALPRLVDLGAGKCQGCKMMSPILEDLKKSYEGRLQVDFVDVRADAEAAKSYGVTVIPTQVFYDPSGKELFRHQGYMSKEDVVAKWKELGYDLDR